MRSANRKKNNNQIVLVKVERSAEMDSEEGYKIHGEKCFQKITKLLE